ncbi:MAG TPA: glycosyltransferase [Anaerolineales bacterium]
MKDLTKASIIVLTYNNLEYTRMCLESIYAHTVYPDFEVVIVDNASREEAVAYLKDFANEKPNVNLILNAENLGFARGNNIGAAAAQGDYLVFLNNDTVVTDGWLSGLIRYLESPEVGMVGPVTNSSGNETRIQVHYQNLDAMHDFAVQRRQEFRGQTFEIPMLAFMCVAMRRSIFDEIGPLDERFGIGMFEDDDYALRLREKGYHIRCAEDIFIHHWGSAGFSKLGFTEYWRIFQDNKLKFEDKWDLQWQPPRYRDELLGEQLTQIVNEKIWLASEVIEKDQVIAELQIKLAEFEAIKQSTGWNLLQFLLRIREWIAPIGSNRDRLGRRGMAVLRKIQQTGVGLIRSYRRRKLVQELNHILSLYPSVEEVVVFPPTIQWNVPLFQRPHQLAQAFARQGCVAFFCEPDDAMTSPQGFTPISDRLYVANVPMDVLATLPSPVVFTLVYNQAYLSDFKDARVVYEYIDELEVFQGEIEDLRCIHEKSLAQADIVVATADRLYQQLRARREDVLLCPNGVDYEFIRGTIESNNGPPEDLKDLVAQGRPIIGYYGALAKWFDYDLLRKAARKRPDYQFVLIGPSYDGSLERSRVEGVGNVHWLGPRKYPDIPNYLKYFDVATIPFQLNEITHSTSPLKLFEYMSGRKPIVTTPMRESEKYPVVLLARDELEFVQRLDEALDLANDPDYLEALDRLAQENTWDLRARAILEALEGVGSSKGHRP